MASDFGNPLRKFKLVFLGEQSGKICLLISYVRHQQLRVLNINFFETLMVIELEHNRAEIYQVYIFCV